MEHPLHNKKNKKRIDKIRLNKINKQKIKNKKLEKKVYELVKKIPKGKITTYKEIANALNTKAYRLIGKILSKNKNKKVPCHRVIMSNGFIGGYQGKKNNSEKIKLLTIEGIKIKNNKIDLKKYYFKL